MSLFSISVFAQTNTGRLVGRVSSPDGIVQGATVLVTDVKTNKGRSVNTGSDGSFTVPQLEVGTYEVKVSAPGFKSFVAKDVKIDIGREYSLPVTMEIGQVQDSVTVTAGSEVLNATTVEWSKKVSRRWI